MLPVASPGPEWFSTWFDSPYYHLLYSSRGYTEAGAFLDALLAHLHPKADARLLDLACGRGRHAVQLSARGYDVTGLDLSPESIAAAQQHAHAGLRFYVHDMRDPLQCGPFDFVLNLFTSFGYFQEESENVVALRNSMTALQPGGKMVVDFLNTERTIQELVTYEHKQVEGVDFHLHRHLDRDFIVKEIKFQTLAGEHHHYQERVRALTLEQFEEYFYLAGLRVAEVLGDYHLAPFDQETSPRMIFILKK